MKDDFLKELKEKLISIYETYIYKIPINMDEVIDNNNYTRIYEIFNQYEDVRDTVKQINILLKSSQKFNKMINKLIALQLVNQLLTIYDSTRKYVFLLEEDKRNHLILSFRKYNKKYLKDICINCCEIDIENILDIVIYNDREELVKKIMPLNFNFKEFYNNNLLSVYHETHLNRLNYLNEENLYLVAILDTLLKEVESDFHKFNGIDHGANKINKNFSYLYELYIQHGHLAIDKERELSRYGLIEIHSERNLLQEIPRIIDTKYNISFGIKYINFLTYKVLHDLHNTYKFKLSFYPDCDELYNFINDFTPILESIEYGEIPSLDDLKNKCLNKKVKFKDYVSSDTFWIKQHALDLTIEELTNDIEVFNDYIVTKVLHLRHIEEAGVLYIEHIDFEYIFYRIDEYFKREDGDFGQKGGGFARQKIFKIDNARIPLQPFLYSIAYHCFNNKELIDESFRAMEIISENE